MTNKQIYCLTSLQTILKSIPLQVPALDSQFDYRRLLWLVRGTKYPNSDFPIAKNRANRPQKATVL